MAGTRSGRPVEASVLGQGVPIRSDPKEGVEMDEVSPGLRSALIDAFDEGVDAKALLLPLAWEPPAFRARHLLSPLRLRQHVFDRSRSATDLQVESAAFGCGRFADALGSLTAVFPDAPLIAVAAPAPTWKRRVWEHDGLGDVADIRAEVRAATRVVDELVNRLHRGVALEPRGA